jgi:hypothetical protein
VTIQRRRRVKSERGDGWPASERAIGGIEITI